MATILDKLLPASRTPWASAASRASLGAFIEQAKQADWGAKLDKLAAGRTILAAAPVQQAEVVDLSIAFIDRLLASLTHGYGMTFSGGDDAMARMPKALASKLLAKPLPWQPDALVRMVDGAALRLHWMPGPGILRAIEKAHAGAPLPASLREALERLLEAARAADSKEARDLVARVEGMLAGPAAASPGALVVEMVDAWTIALTAALAKLTPKRRAAVDALLAHAARATSAKPGTTWLVDVAPLVAAIGRPAHVALLATVLDAVGTPAPFEVAMWAHAGEVSRGDAMLVSPRHDDLLRGLVWSAIAGDSDAVVTRIGDCAERCFKKLAGHGPLAPKIGNACLQVLSHDPSPGAVGQLARLKVRARHSSVRALLDKATTAAADRAGTSTAELEETGVPTCGLDEIGQRTVKLGGVTGTLRIGGDDGVELFWRDGKGKPCAAPRLTDAKVAALVRSRKELAALLPGQRLRLERLLIGGRTIPYATWRERYVDHVLVGALARRLIWWCGQRGKGETARLVGFDGDRLIDVEGKKVAPAADAPMYLWHPIHSAASVVKAWRAWLDKRELRQPFKQAHREVYLLTDAERRTATYSNRFAAHVLRQHQFAALCAVREWRYQKQGQWDSHNTPTLELREHGWRVEYQVDGVEDAGPDGELFPPVGTDRIVFTQVGSDAPARLEDVPRMVFTEAMRDVDLFVGVASIGADPTWREDQPHRAYWQRHAFGDAGESGRSRHDALKRLLPRLAIAKRCTLGERFLTVRGQLRTYHIHLGSAAVQMEPNSQYLCVVSKGDGASGVMLPFEGDHTLSVILSKAFLLAADDQIRDRSIRSQIEAA